MAPEPVRLRLSNRSVVTAVGLAGLTFLLIRLFSASTRVLGWLAVAAIGAALLDPIVGRLATRMRRGLALAAVVVGTLVLVGLLVYASVDAVRRQADALEKGAPKAAREIEESERFGDIATDFRLAERVQTFVDELPERLRGGDAATALRSAATRGVAFLATAVLTIFLLIHGRNLIRGGLGQIRDDARRDHVAAVLTGAYGRAVAYITLTVARVALAGVATWALCALADVPGGILLGIGAAVFSLVPLFGFIIGTIPVLLLTAAFHPGRLLAVLAFVVAYQVAEIMLVQRRLESRSVHIGPVLSLAAMMAGFELYGFGGLLVGLVATIVGAAVVIELAPTPDSDLLRAADEVLAGDDVAPPASAPA